MCECLSISTGTPANLEYVANRLAARQPRIQITRSHSIPTKVGYLVSPCPHVPPVRGDLGRMWLGIMQGIRIMDSDRFTCKRQERSKFTEKAPHPQDSWWVLGWGIRTMLIW